MFSEGPNRRFRQPVSLQGRWGGKFWRPQEADASTPGKQNYSGSKPGGLNLSRWSRLVSTISIKILTQPSLDWKVSILKILTKKKKIWSWLSRKSWHFKKVSLDTKDILDLDWSRLSRPSGLSGSHLMWSNWSRFINPKLFLHTQYSLKRMLNVISFYMYQSDHIKQGPL